MNQYKTSKDSDFLLFLLIAFLGWLGFKFALPLAVAALEWLMRMGPG